MNKSNKSLYVVARNSVHNNICLFSGQIHESKEAAEAEAGKAPLGLNTKVMDIEDYIQGYGENRSPGGESRGGN
jgi:hypothetical protein